MAAVAGRGDWVGTSRPMRRSPGMPATPAETEINAQYNSRRLVIEPSVYPGSSAPTVSRDSPPIIRLTTSPE